jgi:hypothetical protein
LVRRAQKTSHGVAHHELADSFQQGLAVGLQGVPEEQAGA